MPINIATGEASLEFDDIEVPGRVPLRWNARYSTGLVDQVRCPIGRGWFGLAFCTLRRIDGGFVHTTDRGAREHFSDPDDTVIGGGIVRNLGAFLEVFRDRQRYVVRSWNVDTGEVRHLCFDATVDDGRDLLLTAIEDVSGDGIDLVWQSAANAQPRLMAMRQRVERRELRIGYGRAGWIERLEMRAQDGSEQRLATYEHDGSGHLIRIVNAAEFSDRFEYDGAGRVTREVIKDGGVFRYRYDDLGRCVLHTGLSHYNERRLRYLQPVGITEMADSYGNTTTYTYLPSGQIVSEVDPLGGTQTTQYDEHGRTIAKTDANGATTSFAYDAMGNRAVVTNALGHATRIRFNAHHQPLELVQAAGQTWRRAYNDRGRMIGMLDPLGGRWVYEYDGDGNLIGTKNPLGSERTFTYDNGALRSSTDWLGQVTLFGWDRLGRISERRGPLGETTRLRYDKMGKPVEVQLPDGSTISATYDHAGNMTQYVDAMGRVTRWRYGPCARLLERTDPAGGTLRFVWGTERNRVEQFINEKGEIYSFERDSAGRIVAETSFDGARREFRYDAVGNAITYTNANGAKVILTRNGIGQVLAQCLPEGEEMRFSYDAVGRLTQAISPDIAVKFERDALGRITREEQGDHWVDSKYDAAGVLVSTNTSLDHKVTYEVDANGQTTRLVAGAQDLRFERNSRGQEIARTLPGGLRAQQQFDVLGRLITQRVGPVSQSDRQITGAPRPDDIILRSFAYDSSGSLTSTADAQWGTVEYTYDPAERLLRAVRQNGKHEAFSYDSTANVTEIRSSNGKVAQETLILGAGNRLLQKGGTRYEYDGEGRRVAKIEATEMGEEKTWKYEWDALGRLRSVLRPDGEMWRYRYDALGRRIEKESSATCTRFIWDKDVLVHETSRNQRPSAWIFDPRTFVPLASVQDAAFYSVVTDQIGTPSELIDSSGRVAWSGTHKAWGRLAQARTLTKSVSCPLRFQGQWFDAESDLHYNRFRYYDPDIGAYTSQDPRGLPGGVNLYAYPRNPSKYADPLGLCGSPDIDPKDVAGKTPAEIDALAKAAGLTPKGPDPMGGKGAYIDPVTGQQRVLIHPVDPVSGPHAHVNNPAGERLDINRNVVPPESPAAHLPLAPPP